MLEIFAMVVLLVLCCAAIWLLILIGNIPGNMARAVNHPQAEAISMLAWVGLLTLGIGWFAALVWAKVKPLASSADVERRLQQLEEKIGHGESGA